MNIMTRREALASGLKTYINGKACPHGHVSERLTKSGGCVECAKRLEMERSAAGYYNRRYEDESTGVRAKIRAYYEAHKGKVLKNVKDWSRNNPEARRAIANSYKHRRRLLESVGMSTAEFGEWVSAQKKVCYWCGKKCRKAFHVDHYHPLSKGGEHSKGNLVIACPTCNLRKSARDPYAFAAQCGRLF